MGEWGSQIMLVIITSIVLHMYNVHVHVYPGACTHCTSVLHVHVHVPVYTFMQCMLGVAKQRVCMSVS